LNLESATIKFEDFREWAAIRNSVSMNMNNIISFVSLPDWMMTSGVRISVPRKTSI